MDDERRRLSWLAVNLLPHEGEVAAWLRRSMRGDADVQDVIQEAYCRMCAAPDLERIANPRAYFFQVARSIVLDQLRRARVVRIDTVADIEALPLIDDQPSPERVISSRRELQWVSAFLTTLPARAQAVVRMRKIDGLPQKEIARRLGVSENVVENEASRAIRLLLAAMAERGSAEAPARRSPVKGGRRARR